MFRTNVLTMLHRDRRGATLLGYGLTIGLISIVALVALTNVGGGVGSLFTDVAGNLEDAGSEPAASPSEADACAGLPSTPPAAGTLCDDGTVYVGMTKAGSSQTLTPFYTSRCDLGMSYNDLSSACECDSGSLVESGAAIVSSSDTSVGNCDFTGDRSNYPFNDGGINYVDTGLDDIASCPGNGNGDCTEAASPDGDVPGDIADLWHVGWDGQENSDWLIAEDASTSSGFQTHQAVAACQALGAGWYLPGINELDVMYQARDDGALAGSFDASGDYPAQFYWSSSELDDNRVFIQRFDSANQTWTDKLIGLSVRCAYR